jgi:hypothetical protein
MLSRLRWVVAIVLLAGAARASAQDAGALTLGCPPDRPPSPEGDTPAPEEPAVRLALQLVVLWAPVNGYLQIPLGGGAGTTSSQRPTFHELGIDDMIAGDGEARVALWDNTLSAGAQIIRLSGDATLREPLITHGVSFAVGEQLHSDVQLDWYRVAYGYRFDLGDHGGRLHSLPRIGAVLFDFSDTIRGANATARRSFRNANVLFGLEMTWDPEKWLEVGFSTLIAPPISPRTPYVLFGGIGARLFFVGDVDRGIFGLIGVGIERIEFDDQQKPVPNHLVFFAGPVITAGIGGRF